MTHPAIRLGLISAMQQEQAGLIELMQDKHQVSRSLRTYSIGKLEEVDCVCVLSRIGKVAAAATALTLIERFNVTHILFTGVAGAVDHNLRVGDVVVADAPVQHDLNASPIFPRFEVPLLGKACFATDKALSDHLFRVAEDFLTYDFAQAVAPADQQAFRLAAPRVYRGLVASGDQFISSEEKLQELRASLPGLVALEMEGAAVGQVCFESGIPFAVIRTISDCANEHAPRDFMKFIERVASRYAFGVIRRLCHALR